MPRARMLRIGGPVLLAAAFAAWCAWRGGIPASRDTVTAWVLLALLASSATDLRRSARRVVRDWLPFAFALWLYDLSRGRADGLLFHAHYLPQLEADRWLFGVVPTAWLQHRLWHGQAHLRWYDYAAWLVYLSYFFATLLLAAALWKFAPSRFRRYVATVTTLALLGATTYTLFPAAPPWLAAEHGLLPAWRLVPAIWAHVPYVSFQTLVERGSRYSNKVAAVPSLHTAFTLLVSLTLWPVAPRVVKPLLVLYPLAMGFALVYLGEHYALDVLLGYAYALVAFFVVRSAAIALARRRACSRTPAEGAPART